MYNPTGRIYDNVIDLQNAIQQEIQNISLEMFRKSIRNFVKRIDKCIQNDGEFFE